MCLSFSRDRERRERVPGEEVEEGVVKIKQEPEDGNDITFFVLHFEKNWKKTVNNILELTLKSFFGLSQTLLKGICSSNLSSYLILLFFPNCHCDTGMNYFYK